VQVEGPVNFGSGFAFLFCFCFLGELFYCC